MKKLILFVVLMLFAGNAYAQSWTGWTDFRFSDTGRVCKPCKALTYQGYIVRVIHRSDGEIPLNCGEAVYLYETNEHWHVTPDETSKGGCKRASTSGTANIFMMQQRDRNYSGSSDTH